MEIRINKTSLLAGLLVIVGITLRLVPHVANFAPIGAIALFAGAVFGRRTAIWLPLTIMVISDLIIGLYPGILFTWTAFALVSLYGTLFQRTSNKIRITIGAFGSSLIFFVISNLGVWLEGKLYPLTVHGFFECYIMALPFLRATVISDVVYSTILFGAFALAFRFIKGTALISIPITRHSIES